MGDDCGALSYSNNCYGSVVSYGDDDEDDCGSGFYFGLYGYGDDDSDSDGFYYGLDHDSDYDGEPCGDYGYGFEHDLYAYFDCDYDSSSKIAQESNTMVTSNVLMDFCGTVKNV